MALSMARPTTALIKKRGRPAKSTTTTTTTTKQAKTSLLLDLFWFSASVFCEGWEVFHQTLLKSFSFPPQFSTRLEGFLSINLVFFFIIFSGLGA